MKHRLATTIVSCVLGTAGLVRADVVVSFDLKDAGGAAIQGDVAAGTRIFADILLSTDAAETTPIADVRSIQFSVSETSSTLGLENFTWLIGPIYGLQDNSLPTPAAVTLQTSSSAQLLTLDSTPVAVASVEVVANATGTLDVRGAPDATADFVARVSVDFEIPSEFTPQLENLTGGTLGITVTSGGTNGGPPTDDRDNDGVPDADDAFPDDPAETTDTDGDGIGDVADTDDDGDGIADDLDEFPLDPAETTDTDGDGVGDVGDAFPQDGTETVDSDDDGLGDTADPDDDNDGVTDEVDAFPLDPAETSDTDNNGIGDNADAAGDSGNRGPVAGGAVCGFGMLGSMMFLFACMGVVRLHRRPLATRS